MHCAIVSGSLVRPSSTQAEHQRRHCRHSSIHRSTVDVVVVAIGNLPPFFWCDGVATGCVRGGFEPFNLSILCPDNSREDENVECEGGRWFSSDSLALKSEQA